MLMVECEASVTSCYVHVAHVMMVARTPGLQDSRKLLFIELSTKYYVGSYFK